MESCVVFFSKFFFGFLRFIFKISGIITKPTGDRPNPRIAWNPFCQLVNPRPRRSCYFFGNFLIFGIFFHFYFNLLYYLNTLRKVVS
ncbi:hypothetical protein BDV40DRAFT_270939 [Aspergillus tamarii]|uniref:Uncharacterized protein n=1 Tax=Aspergillus tamarii TaxID=41984 RepID=A0A5N6UNZ2_ASPTM|nr:hypothetical protein BDV40DRAFT_270939 [Aspergillus tamarii]